MDRFEREQRQGVSDITYLATSATVEIVTIIGLLLPTPILTREEKNALMATAVTVGIHALAILTKRTNN